MSHCHLNHLISWKVLSDCLFRPAENSIYLPIGSCNCIHIINKKVEIQIQNRNYIKEKDICNSKECETIGSRSFSKGENSQRHELCPVNYRPPFANIKKQLQFFISKLSETLVEFAETEEKKFHTKKCSIEPDSTPFCSELSGYSFIHNKCLSAYLDENAFQIMYLDETNQIDLHSALDEKQGGQAIGRGYFFLVQWHLIPFYLTANMIIHCNYQNDQSKWGKLNKETSYFYGDLLRDCDFLTFIPRLRPLLAEDIFMKDLEKTNELLKSIFNYICKFIWMGVKSKYIILDDKSVDRETLHKIIEQSIKYAFRLE